MALGGLIGSTKKLAAQYAAQGKKSASQTSAAKTRIPSPEALAQAAEQVAQTPDSKDRRKAHRGGGDTTAARNGQTWTDTQRWNA